MVRTTVTRNGQITLRKEIRHELDIEEGTELNINTKGNVIMMKKVNEDSWDELESFLPEDFETVLEESRATSARRAEERTP